MRSRLRVAVRIVATKGKNQLRRAFALSRARCALSPSSLQKEKSDPFFSFFQFIGCSCYRPFSVCQAETWSFFEPDLKMLNLTPAMGPSSAKMSLR